MKKPKRQRHRTAAGYEADIAARQDVLRVQCEQLDRFRIQMEAIQEEFRANRRAIFDSEARCSRRPVSSGLTLEMTVSQVTRAPRAVWKHYVRLPRNHKSGLLHITQAISKRHQNEWLPGELARYAHRSEIFLVCDIEARLAVLRKKVRPLSKAAQKNAIAVMQLTRQFRARFGWGTPERRPVAQAPAVPQERKQVPAWARDPEPDEEKYVPQFKHPDGVL